MFISEGIYSKFVSLKGRTEIEKPYSFFFHDNKVISDDNKFSNFMYTTFQRQQLYFDFYKDLTENYLRRRQIFCMKQQNN